MYRRISRSYLRQLWDEDYTTIALEDAEKEPHFRAVSTCYIFCVCMCMYRCLCVVGGFANEVG